MWESVAIVAVTTSGRTSRVQSSRKIMQVEYRRYDAVVPTINMMVVTIHGIVFRGSEFVLRVICVASVLLPLISLL